MNTQEKQTEISTILITELLLYQQIFEKEGCLNTTFERVLNEKEIALVELLGFSHQTNYLPYLEEEDPLGFYKRGDFISSIHKTTD